MVGMGDGDCINWSIGRFRVVHMDCGDLMNKEITAYTGHIIVMRTDRFVYHFYPCIYSDGSKGTDMVKISRLDPRSELNWHEKFHDMRQKMDAETVGG